MSAVVLKFIWSNRRLWLFIYLVLEPGSPKYFFFFLSTVRIPCLKIANQRGWLRLHNWFTNQSRFPLSSFERSNWKNFTVETGFWKLLPIEKKKCISLSSNYRDTRRGSVRCGYEPIIVPYVSKPQRQTWEPGIALACVLLVWKKNVHSNVHSHVRLRADFNPQMKCGMKRTTGHFKEM